jgi:hypothetical protein
MFSLTKFLELQSRHGNIYLGGKNGSNLTPYLI